MGKMFNKRAWQVAFPATAPILMGYLSIGLAFGLLMDAAGYGAQWSGLMSVIVFAGSSQFVGAELLGRGAALSEFALLTLVVNFRHLVYGLSMLEKFRDMGRRKPLMIFTLTDETYALLTSLPVPPDVDEHDVYFAVSLLNYAYWVLGSVLGGLVGALLTINTAGIDFALTALFVVIAVEQWQSADSHLPALLGLGATLLSLLCVGPDNLLLPALAAIILGLLALRKKLAPAVQADGEGGASC